MDFLSTRIITDDPNRLVTFYEKVTGIPAVWRAPDVFAEIRTDHGTLAIGATRTIELASPGAARSSANASVIVEFRVDDVDALFPTLSDVDVVMEPKTMPWGNRSLLVRDPDGNLVNFFTPGAPPAA